MIAFFPLCFQVFVYLSFSSSSSSPPLAVQPAKLKMALHYIILFLIFLKAVTFFVQSRHSAIQQDSAAAILSQDHLSTSESALLKQPPRHTLSVEVLGWSIGISVG